MVSPMKINSNAVQPSGFVLNEDRPPSVAIWHAPVVEFTRQQKCVLSVNLEAMLIPCEAVTVLLEICHIAS